MVQNMSNRVVRKLVRGCLRSLRRGEMWPNREEAELATRQGKKFLNRLTQTRVLINELGYMVDDVGGVTVACEDATLFDECNDWAMMCSEVLGEWLISLIVSACLVQSRFTFGPLRGRFGKRLFDRLSSVEVGRKKWCWRKW